MNNFKVKSGDIIYKKHSNILNGQAYGLVYEIDGVLYAQGINGNTWWSHTKADFDKVYRFFDGGAIRGAFEKIARGDKLPEKNLVFPEPKPVAVEMTVAEISKELGYEVKVVK